MSVITANPSLISAQGRSRVSSKHLRNYQRVSEVNLDEKAILSYLRSHDLHRTLATFVTQTNYCENIEPLLKTIEVGASEFSGDLQSFVESIRSQCEGKQNKSNSKWLIVEFFLHIWYIVGKDHIEKSRIYHLKNYINSKGDSLSELPELLPYFALPYAQNPITHPFLHKIFTVEWKNELKVLILDLAGKKPEHKHEEQWLNIIEDMIQICFELFTHIQAKAPSAKCASMMERVKLYQYVIQKNKDAQLKPHQEPTDQGQTIKLDFSNVQNIKAKIQGYRVDWMKNKKLGSGLNIDLLFHGIQKELHSLEKFKEDKKYVAKLIDHDILSLEGRQTKMEFEELKVLQIMSSYLSGRAYIEKYGRIVAEMKSIIVEHYHETNLPPHHLDTLIICFDVLKKLVIRPVVFKKIIEEKGLIETVLTIFETLKALFLKGGKSLYTKALTYNTMLLTQLTLHKKGRQILQKKNYFDMIALFFKQIASDSIDQTLENELCSSIYLLLVEPEIRERANRLKLKDILLDRMLWKKNQRYETLVSYIIQRIEMDQEIEEGNSDIDEEKSVEYDSKIQLEQSIIRHRGEKIKIDDLSQLSKRGENQKESERKRDSRSLTNKQKRESKQKKIRRKIQEKDSYSPLKYQWKSSKPNHIKDAKYGKDFNL